MAKGRDGAFVLNKAQFNMCNKHPVSQMIDKLIAKDEKNPDDGNKNVTNQHGEVGCDCL